MKILKSPEIDELVELIEENLEESLGQSDYFNEYLNKVDSNQENGSFESSKLLNINDYSSDPYLKLFKNENFRKGNIEFKIAKYKKFSSFLYNEILSENGVFLEDNPIGHFDKEFSYPAIYRGKTPWMSIIPHEINTMKKSIDDSFGDVLTFGCGLGYYAFMASNKENVKSVTIVDNDPNVISIFKENILPKFPHKEKISVICTNCFKFCKDSSKKYDYLFVDTYHTPEDGLPFFIELQPMLKKIASQSSFWILPTMITYFKRYLLYVFVDIYNGNVKDEDFIVTGEDILDDILAKYIIKTKAQVITNLDDALMFLSDETILKNLSELN